MKNTDDMMDAEITDFLASEQICSPPSIDHIYSKTSPIQTPNSVSSSANNTIMLQPGSWNTPPASPRHDASPFNTGITSPMKGSVESDVMCDDNQGRSPLEVQTCFLNQCNNPNTAVGGSHQLTPGSSPRSAVLNHGRNASVIGFKFNDQQNAQTFPRTTDRAIHTSNPTCIPTFTNTSAFPLVNCSVPHSGILANFHSFSTSITHSSSTVTVTTKGSPANMEIMNATNNHSDMISNPSYCNINDTEHKATGMNTPTGMDTDATNPGEKPVSYFQQDCTPHTHIYEDSMNISSLLPSSIVRVVIGDVKTMECHPDNRTNMFENQSHLTNTTSSLETNIPDSISMGNIRQDNPMFDGHGGVSSNCMRGEIQQAGVFGPPTAKQSNFTELMGSQPRTAFEAVGRMVVDSGNVLDDDSELVEINYKDIEELLFQITMEELNVH